MNPAADKLLRMLRTERGDFGRFHDAYLTFAHGEFRIVVVAAIGGFARRTHGDVIERVTGHRFFRRDWDNGGDRTFASFEFDVPPEHSAALRALFAEQSARAAG